MKSTENWHTKDKFLIYPKALAFAPRRSNLADRPEADSLIYWKLFFDFAYYVGLSTFRFKFNEITGSWYTVKTELQQISVSWFLITISPSGAYFDTSSNPVAYFELASEISTLAYFFVFPYMNLTKEKAILAVFNTIQNQMRSNRKLKSGSSAQVHNLLVRMGLKKRVILTRSICIFFSTVMAMLSISASVQGAGWKWTNVLGRMTKVARRFYITESPHILLVYCLTGLWLYQKVVTLYLELSFVLTTLFFYHLAQDFISVLSTNLIPAEIIDSHKMLKVAVNSINEAYGAFSFLFTIGAMPFYCEIFVTFFTSMSSVARIRLSLYFIYFIGCLVVLAMDHKKIGNELYNWIYIKGNYGRMTQSELSVLLHDLSNNNLGLSAGNSIITFGLLNSILGLVITYVVILFQFRMSSGGPGQQCNCTQS